METMGHALTISSGRRKGLRQSWLPLLPTELRIHLLLTIGAQNKGIESSMRLAREFPEFGRLVLLIQWTMDEVVDLSQSEIKVVDMYDYAECSKREFDQRPVKVLAKDFTNAHLQQFPSHKLDGSTHCFLNRFINSSTLVNVLSISESASCVLLDGSRQSLGLSTEINRDETVEVKTYSWDFKYDGSEADDNEPENFKYEVLERLEDSDSTYDYYLSARDDNSRDQHGQMSTSVTVPKYFSYNLPHYDISGLEVSEYLEVRLSKRSLSPTTAPRVRIDTLPRRLLHLTFDSYSLPTMYTVGRWSGQMCDCFIIQNGNWSPNNPYGLSINPFQHEELVNVDQATYHQAITEHWLREGGTTNIIFPFQNFKTVKLYGIPDPTVIWSPMNNVKCLYWWRLSSKVVDTEEDDVPHIVECTALKELHIISVIKEHDKRPLLQVPQLERLVLVSLRESDVSWNLGDTLFGETPCLRDVYLERRLDLEEEPYPPMSIGDKDLTMISSTVTTLHIRGYIPDFLILERSTPEHQFENLQTLILDVSETHRVNNITDAGSGVVTLEFDEEKFPNLSSISLMCTKETYLADGLSQTRLVVGLGNQCSCANISDLVRPLSLSFNGQQLDLDEHRSTELEVPVEQGRKCQKWEPDGNGCWKFREEVMFLDWVVGVREY